MRDKGLFKRAGCFTAIVVVIGLVVVSMMVVPVFGERVLWEARGGAISPPRQFKMVLFPKQQSSAGTVGIPDRAVLVDWTEWNSGGAVTNWIGASEQVVARESVVLWEPDSMRREMLVDRLNAAFNAWGAATDWKDIAVTSIERPNGGVEVSVRLRVKRGSSEVFVYVVHRDGLVEPASMRGTPTL